MSYSFLILLVFTYLLSNIKCSSFLNFKCFIINFEYYQSLHNLLFKCHLYKILIYFHINLCHSFCFIQSFNFLVCSFIYNKKILVFIYENWGAIGVLNYSLPKRCPIIFLLHLNLLYSKYYSFFINVLMLI